MMKENGTYLHTEDQKNGDVMGRQDRAKRRAAWLIKQRGLSPAEAWQKAALEFGVIMET